MGTAWVDDDGNRMNYSQIPCLGFSRTLGSAPDALEEARRFAGRCNPVSSETASGVCRFVDSQVNGKSNSRQGEQRTLPGGSADVSER